MNWFKENWFKVGVIVMVVLAGVFYWYEWRPAQARKVCSEIASGSQDEGFIPGKFVAEYTGETYFDEVGYNKCLREKGIEP